MQQRRLANRVKSRPPRLWAAVARCAIPHYLAFFFASWLGWARESPASVVVFHNTTAETVRLVAIPHGAPSRIVVIEPGESRTACAPGRLEVQLPTRRRASSQPVDSDSAYDLVPTPRPQEVALRKIPLGGGVLPTSGADAALARIELSGGDAIAVKILVDDDELRRRPVWERTLRQRIADASEVLRAHAGVGLRVVGVGTWDSDDRELDFSRSLREFEQEAPCGQAQVAIGFTSQYQVQRGRFHMGGTRGPLHAHILIKERARGLLETERLELLVHELGHFLGASHSSDPNSVMRPVLDRGPQRAAGSRLLFDPANTLLIAMMGEEIRFRRVRKMEDVSPSTRRRMSAICAALEPKLPEDPAASQIRLLLSVASASQIVEDVQHVLGAVVTTAELQRQTMPEGSGTAAARQLEGDDLLELYVRRAAAATREIEHETARQAMLLALGIAIDDTDALRSNPASGGLVQRVEDEFARSRRLAVMGNPTMRGRADLAKHFFVSAHATALVGGNAARVAGIFKESSDAQGGTGFSFADIQANLSGIAFANALVRGQLLLDDLERGFRVEDFMPPIDGLQEGLDAAAFEREYGGVDDPRTRAEISRIQAAIGKLPVYRQRNR